MEACFHLHKRFLEASTSGLSVFRLLDASFESSPISFIHELLDGYYKNSLKTKLTFFEALRPLLCYEYQLKFSDFSQLKNVSSTPDLPRSLIKSHLHSHLDGNTRSIIEDTTVLQIVLYLGSKDVKELCQRALESSGAQKRSKPLQDSGKAQKCLKTHLQIVENLVDSICLRQMLRIDEASDLSDVFPLFQTEIGSWFEIINENSSEEWSSFVAILLKLTTSFPANFLEFSWNLIVSDGPIPTERSLSLLSAILDDLLTIEIDELTSKNLEFCFSEKILRLISRNLTSSTQLCRRHAQYILRKIVEYSRKAPRHLLQEYEEKSLQPPFVFPDDEELNMEESMKNFFDLLAALEEKRADLVLPEINRLDNLLHASIAEGSIDIMWIRCIFTRLLTHDNTKVIKASLSVLLKMEFEIFDDGFIALTVQSLNHAFLFDNQGEDQPPKILKALSALFVTAERSKTGFMKKFSASAGKIPWHPIPLYYLLEALGNSKKFVLLEPWGRQELQALNTIARNCLKNQIGLLQIATKWNILKCVKLYVRSPDLQDLLELIGVIRDKDFLHRDSQGFRLLVKYLMENVEEAKALDFISGFFEGLTNQSNETIESLGLFLVLLFDSYTIFFNACVCANALGKLFSSLADSSTNEATIAALRLINSLMSTHVRIEDCYVMQIFGSSRFIIDLIFRRLASEPPETLDECNLYIQSLKSMIKLGSLSPDFSKALIDRMKIDNSEFDRITASINSEETPLLHALYSLNILFLTSPDKVYCHRNAVSHPDPEVAAEFHHLTAEIHLHNIKSPQIYPDIFYKQLLTETLGKFADCKGLEAIPLITEIIQKILRVFSNPMLMAHSELLQNLIEVCWMILWSSRRGPAFYDSAKCMISLIWSESFLRVSKLRPLVLKYAGDVLRRSDNSSPLRSFLFLQINSLSSEDIFFCRHSFLAAILDVGGAETGKRMEMQTCRLVLKDIENFNPCDRDSLVGLGIYGDVVTRALLIVLILKLGSSIGQNERDNILVNFLGDLLSLLQERQGKVYFEDSEDHRIKYRVMQLLLLLSLRDEDALKVHDALGSLILSENNIPSIRIILEWILIRIYLDNENLTNHIWDLFSACRDQSGSLRSLMSIVYHVAKSLRPTQKLLYLRKAVRQILPSCFAGDPQIQNHAQMIVQRLFRMLDSCGDSSEWEVVQKALGESLEARRPSQRSSSMLDDLYHEQFNAVGDFNLQTIFWNLPRLSNVAGDEWIESNVFRRLLPDHLKIRWLRYLECGGTLVRPDRVGLRPKDEGGDLSLVKRAQAEANEVRKIQAPRIALSPMELRQKLIYEDTGLIVVATLVEDKGLLGRLVRTANMLCAREIVLGSKRIMGSKEFLVHSSSAEKWTAVAQVELCELRNYLRDRKTRGWHIVGAEQRNGACSLANFRYQEKTVLVLGSENGIPVNLSHLMDALVYIPEAEFIRSINLDVTAGIFMWHYAQQHLF